MVLGTYLNAEGSNLSENLLQESHIYDFCAFQLVVLILGSCRMGICGGWAGMGQEAQWKEGPVRKAADPVRQSV